MPRIMTPKHFLWPEFCRRLEGPEGCDFKEDGTWKCGGGHDQSKSETILKSMPGVDVEESLKYFTAHGGHCDCEVLFNVEARAQAEEATH